MNMQIKNLKKGKILDKITKNLKKKSRERG